jgi:hypothetical protein
MERAITAAWNSGVMPQRRPRMSNGEFIATLHTKWTALNALRSGNRLMDSAPCAKTSYPFCSSAGRVSRENRIPGCILLSPGF